MLVTFSGLDGAGKTTLITALAGVLESSGRSVTRLTMYDDIGLYSAVRLIRRSLSERYSRQDAKTPSLAADVGIGNRMRAAVLSVVRMRLVKGLLLPLDLVFFLVRRSWVMNGKTDVIVMDRYFYDSLVELRAETVWWGRLFLAVLPSPSVSVFVAVDPAVAFARKGEYDVPELSRRDRAYRTLLSRLPHCVVIRNDVLNDAKEQVANVVLAGFTSRP